jgi:hypothetical protein
MFLNLSVLCYSNAEITARHNELCKAGAIWEHPEFKSHITIGSLPFGLPSPDFPIVLAHEYYGTWESNQK